MGLFGNLMNFNRQSKLVLPPTHPIHSRITAALGYEVAETRDYEQRLVPALNATVAYYEKQIAQIPGPLPMSENAYGHDAMLRAIFPTIDDIRHCLGRSIEVKQSLLKLANSSQGQLCALLGMRCRPDETRPGAPFTYVDHTLRSLTPSEAETREDLRDAALMRLIANFTEHVEKLQRKGKLLREEWNIENRKAGLAGGDEYVYAGTELLPENMLRGLLAWLETPEEHLQVAPADSAADGGKPAEHGFPILESADRRHWISCIVRFPTQEAITAVNTEKRTHRYIFI